MRLEAEVIIATGGGLWAVRPPMTQAEREAIRARGIAPLSTAEVEAVEEAGPMPQASVEALRLVLVTIGGRVESARNTKESAK